MLDDKQLDTASLDTAKNTIQSVMEGKEDD